MQVSLSVIRSKMYVLLQTPMMLYHKTSACHPQTVSTQTTRGNCRRCICASLAVCTQTFVQSVMLLTNDVHAMHSMHM